MRRRQSPSPPIPRLWLMTDERLGDRLWAALERLPRGSGIVFRHYRLPKAERRKMFGQVARIARRRNLMLVAAAADGLTTARLDGVHNHTGRPHIHAGFRTASAHNLREVIAACRRGADIVFLSPVYATRSHPGAKGIGALRFGLLARGSRVPVIALGGMNAARGRRMKGLGAYGWAGIDAWS
ncbi:thiamine phosphate synthase [Allosphingosinicella flava]|uniref:Thiamine phosphate synthase n=1 Tax=Allosphingosinicella flava TaxID=2771430 RepID=A0A7T2GII3_9SPHN|nr:thiamine phosphate synthase [Sphingosinicella flava]QPQ54526.1 thiamine phosphate synthase [Sphingosinicella flava]